MKKILASLALIIMLNATSTQAQINTHNFLNYLKCSDKKCFTDSIKVKGYVFVKEDVVKDEGGYEDYYYESKVLPTGSKMKCSILFSPDYLNGNSLVFETDLDSYYKKFLVDMPALGFRQTETSDMDGVAQTRFENSATRCETIVNVINTGGKIRYKFYFKSK